MSRTAICVVAVVAVADAVLMVFGVAEVSVQVVVATAVGPFRNSRI